VKQAFVLAAFAATLAALPAQAQPVAADLLPAYEVNTIVASMGMRPVGRPAWMRGRYVVAAIDRYGRDVNVVLDARDGQVLAVRPLGRGGFGAPPPRYAPRPVPHDRMDDSAAPPASTPEAPPPDDDEFFDNDRQHGSMPARPTARTAPAPRDPSVTGSITRSVPAARRESAPKDATPVPRPRPALARANDPGNTPAAASKPAQAEAKAEVKPDASKPDAPKPEVRVIDLSKPKTAPKPEDKPGEAIRF
jgi:hypothetical protein